MTAPSHRSGDGPGVPRGPHGATTWAAVQQAATTVESLLAEGDVRLTAGSEPTFSVAGSTDPQWHTAADGADKRARAVALAERLRDRWAPGGLVTSGPGKWYPGEPTPRWALHVVWRIDGTPLWPSTELLHSPTLGADGAPGPVAPDAEAFARALVTAIGAPADVLLAAYEDPLAVAAAAARVPPGEPPPPDVAPWDTELATRRERAAWAAALDEQADAPVAWVLPLHRSEDGAAWATTRWRPRRGRLFLLPGTGAAGLRIPLDSLAWRWPPGRPQRSPFDEPSPLLAASVAASARTVPRAGDAGVVGAEATPQPTPPWRVVPVDEAPTTAVAIEVRDGITHVFCPPLDDAEPAIELVAAIHAAAVATGQRIVLEGYPLPRDPGIQSLSVTPDPGVVEVNLHPMASWDELVAAAVTLDREARAVGLTSALVGPDGHPATTGGGSHLTIGAARPADSPVLRRPDLLVSMVTYWQHHPSLSYLFTGQFLGPTCQAPRVDEARHESLDELEIAFAHIDAVTAALTSLRLPDGRPVPPPRWLVARALGHLLVDVTGNTHRAEFCIDKLFSPATESGRLGLLELRAFEMPGSPQLWLLQHLLVRGIIARLWAEPYRGDLQRWGTALHDRFMLPSVLQHDLTTVLDDLRVHGVDLDPAWFEPFVAARFPVLVETVGHGVDHRLTIRVRRAAEPWPVLADGNGGGTSRPVDSQLARLEVELTTTDGAALPHLRVTAAGRPVPLHPIGDDPTRLVGGVRYKATHLHDGLHPTIAAQVPLLLRIWSDDRCAAEILVEQPVFGAPPADAAEAAMRRERCAVVLPARTVTVSTETTAGPEPSHWTVDLRRPTQGVGYRSLGRGTPALAPTGDGG